MIKFFLCNSYYLDFFVGIMVLFSFYNYFFRNCCFCVLIEELKLKGLKNVYKINILMFFYY